MCVRARCGALLEAGSLSCQKVPHQVPDFSSRLLDGPILFNLVVVLMHHSELVFIPLLIKNRDHFAVRNARFRHGALLAVTVNTTHPYE